MLFSDFHSDETENRPLSMPPVHALTVLVFGQA